MTKEKEFESFEDWDRKRVYHNKILLVISSLISIAFVWCIFVIGVIK